MDCRHIKISLSVQKFMIGGGPPSLTSNFFPLIKVSKFCMSIFSGSGIYTQILLTLFFCVVDSIVPWVLVGLG